MLEINGTHYRLLGLDTNVMSQILRDGDAARAGLFACFQEGYVPCFSVYSLFELRRRREIFDAFVDFFDVVPCMVLKGYDELFEAELERYPDPSNLDPTIMGFSVLNTQKRTNLRSLLEVVFADPPTVQREAEWPALQREILESWLDLKPNYPPKGRRHIPPEGIRFVKEVTRQQVAERAPEFLRSVHDSGQALSVDAFPSLRMQLWTVFFRIYLSGNRKPEPQDVFDVLISCPAPHLDAVVTENHQADIYRQVGRFDPLVKNLRVMTLKDLRASG